MKEHKKHVKLARPTRGMYHRSEWGVYGTTCGRINELFGQLRDALTAQYHVAIVDADHHNDIDGRHLQIGKKQYHTTSRAQNEYDDKLLCQDADVVFVNGNHYPAARQILILDTQKVESLKRRADQLTQIDVLMGELTDEYGFIKEKITADTQCLELADEKGLIQYLARALDANKPQLKALILAGGKSQRMGEDKTQISYHDGLSQEVYTANMCNDLGLETYISKAQSAESHISGYEVITDKMVGLGPMGAILSAQMHDPDAAWLVLPCDLPMMDQSCLEELIAQRDTRRYATSYRVSDESFPEPLISIYEPRSYGRLLSFLSLGYSCPRKMLINTDVKLVTMADPHKAQNVNTPKERQAVIEQL